MVRLCVDLLPLEQTRRDPLRSDNLKWQCCCCCCCKYLTLLPFLLLRGERTGNGQAEAANDICNFAMKVSGENKVGDAEKLMLAPLFRSVRERMGGEGMVRVGR